MITTVQRAAGALLLALVIAFGATVTSAGKAEAASTSCGGGRCTVYLTNAETRALGRGSIPKIAAPPPLMAAYYAAAYGHKWIAANYGARGLCSAFRLSVVPWESQGFMARAC